MQLKRHTGLVAISLLIACSAHAATTPPTDKGSVAQAETSLVGGNIDAAVQTLQASLSAAEKVQDKKTTVTCLTHLADCRQKQGDIAEEETLRERALAVAREAYGAQSAQAAMMQAELAGMLARKGDVAQAESALESAKGLLANATGANALEKALVELNEAALDVARGTPGMAEDSFKTATALLDDKSQYYLVRALEEYATALEQMDRKDDARVVREKLALTKGTGTGTTAPAAAAAPKEDSKFAEYVKSAQAAVQKQEHQASMANWKLALSEAEKGGQTDGRQAFVLVRLGDEYHFAKQTTEAEAMYTKAAELREKANATRTLGMARNLTRLGSLALERREYKEAERLLSRAIELEDQLGANDSVLIMTLQPFSSATMMTKNVPQCETVCRRMIEIANHGRIGIATQIRTMATGMLGGLYVQNGRMQEGMQLLQQMSPMATQQLSPEAMTKLYTEEYMKADQQIDEQELKSF